MRAPTGASVNISYRRSGSWGRDRNRTDAHESIASHGGGVLPGALADRLARLARPGLDVRRPIDHRERVLVTGANGFVGRHLVRALREAGYHVRAMLRNPETRPDDWPDDVELALGDVRDEDAVDDAVSGSHLVFHLAALHRAASASRRAYWDVNVDGTKRVLAACGRHHVSRLVYCSTMGIHGSVRHVPSDEEAPFAPGDDYQRSKLTAEQAVWLWYGLTEIPTTVIRPAGIYGPGDVQFLKLFRSIQRGEFVMLGDGHAWVHPVYIDDLIDAFLRCGTKPAAVGEAFCISGERYVRLSELIDLIAQALAVPAPTRRLPVWPVYMAGVVCDAVCGPLGITPPPLRRRADFFTQDRAFTSRKAARLLGYAPRIDLADGLQRTAAWYRDEGLLDGSAAVARAWPR